MKLYLIENILNHLTLERHSEQYYFKQKFKL